VEIAELEHTRLEITETLSDQNFLSPLNSEDSAERLKLQQWCIPQLYFSLHEVLFRLGLYPEW
jgi:hypothetical protein